MQTNHGLTLDRYLEKKSRLEPLQAARIAIQIAQQLGSAGGHFLIHPGRILVAKDGSAKLLPPASEELSLPVVVEYPAYASPEEIRGGQADVRSGLYSLGCTLYELITGKPPFSRTDPKQVLHAHLEAPPPDIRAAAPGIPEHIASAIADLLVKDPRERIQSPGELVRRIRGSAPAPHPANSLAAAAPPSPKLPPVKAPSAGRLPRSEPQPAPISPRPLARPESPLTGRSHRGLAAAGTNRNASKSGSSRRQGAAHRSRTGRRGAGGGFQEDEEDEEAHQPPAPSGGKHKFAVAGLILGALLSVLVVVQNRNRNAASEVEAVETLIKDTRAIVTTRKKGLEDELSRQKKEITDFLEKVQRSPAASRQEMLIAKVQSSASNPFRHLISSEIVKIWVSPASVLPPETPEEEAEFQKQREEAEALHGAGKLGLAIDRIRDNEQKFKARHGKEMDERILKWSAELDEKWKNDEAQVNQLQKERQFQKAAAILEAAKEYGDGAIIRAAERQQLLIQEQDVITAGAGGKGSKEISDAAEEAEAPDPGEGGEAMKKKDEAPESEFEDPGKDK